MPVNPRAWKLRRGNCYKYEVSLFCVVSSCLTAPPTTVPTEQKKEIELLTELAERGWNAEADVPELTGSDIIMGRGMGKSRMKHRIRRVSLSHQPGLNSLLPY